jgi:hypothetical protein
MPPLLIILAPLSVMVLLLTAIVPELIVQAPKLPAELFDTLYLLCRAQWLAAAVCAQLFQLPHASDYPAGRGPTTPAVVCPQPDGFSRRPVVLYSKGLAE